MCIRVGSQSVTWIKPRYVEPGQLNVAGETAARVAAQKGHADIVELLQGLGVDADVDYEVVLSAAMLL